MAFVLYTIYKNVVGVHGPYAVFPYIVLAVLVLAVLVVAALLVTLVPGLADRVRTRIAAGDEAP